MFGYFKWIRDVVESEKGIMCIVKIEEVRNYIDWFSSLSEIAKKFLDVRPGFYNTVILLTLHILLMLVSETHVPPDCRLTPPRLAGLPG